MKTLFLLGTLVFSLALQAQTYTTFKVGNYSTQPNGFSNSGEVVGVFYEPNIYGGTTPYGFWRDPQGKMHRLSSSELPFAVNSSGEFVGLWGTQTCFQEVPPKRTLYLAHVAGIACNAVNSTGWSAGSRNWSGRDGSYAYSWLANPQGDMTVRFAGGSGSGVSGMNDLGQVIGSYFVLTGNTETVYAYFYDGKELNDLSVPAAASTYPSAINDSSEVVGSWLDAQGNEHGFSWTSAGGYLTFDVPGALGTEPTGINASGVIVGTFQNESGDSQGFLLSDGTFTTLSVPGAAGTYALSVNDNGIVAGTWSTKTGPSRGFLYTPAN
jgi:probable HAF family extracellular repeat protein